MDHMLFRDVSFTVVAVVFTLVCLVTDVRSRRIPNWLTVPVWALGLVAHLAVGGWDGLLLSLGGFATGFGILFVLWLFGGGGGGDVKMMSALGAWLGAWLTVWAFLASAVVTVVIVAIALVRGAVPERIRWFKKSGPPSKKGASSPKSKKDTTRPGRIVPYAVPLALGTWAVLVIAWWKTGALF